MSDNSRVYEILGLIQQTHILIEDEIAAYGETWALADANALVVDALSQIKGELTARLSGEADRITAIVVKGAAA